MSGHFGCITQERAEQWLAAIGFKDFAIHPPRRGRPYDYTVTDTYRPGREYVGRTPRKALLAAGLIPPMRL